MHSLGNVDESLKDQLLNNFRTADISDEDKLILEYAEKITIAPSKITKDDIDKLREAGFGNQEIHDIAQVASYFNYINRLADGLGIELEEGCE